MRIFAFIILTALMLLPVAACTEGKTALPPASAVQKSENYICPMHRHVHGKKGGTCPICGMPLIPAHE
jgi:hypothetical protein